MADINKQVTPEQLSQLMDGEWHDLDVQQCVANVCKDDVLKRQWARWHVIRDVARGEPVSLPEHASVLTSRIHDAIAEEPTYTNVRSIVSGEAIGGEAASGQSAASAAASAASAEEQAVRKPIAWHSAFTGAALAASVAVATVVGLDVIGSDPDQSGAQAPTSVATADGNIAQPTIAEVEFVANSEPGSFRVSESDQSALSRSIAHDRFELFINEHLDHSPTAQRSGMLPYSRLIGIDEAPGDNISKAVGQ